jgi:two-component system nitrogen regulation sensor histidine kinase NtrY
LTGLYLTIWLSETGLEDEMLLFLLCTGFIVCVLLVLCIIVWKKNPKNRFRAKLTIIFLLFVTIPAVPLTFITSSLLSGSVRMLIPEQIGDALLLSLECLKTQIAETGYQFMKTFPDSSDWQPAHLDREGIHYLIVYSAKPGSSRLNRTITGSNSKPSPLQPLSAPQIRRRYQQGVSSQLIPGANSDWVVTYQSGTDSSLIALVYPVEPRLVTARHRIETALAMTNTLSLFKESIVEKKLIWGLSVLLIIALLMTAWAVSQRLSKEMTRPMQALVNGMETASTGNLTVQIEEKAKDEFRFLIDRFNIMIRELHETHRRLIQAERLAAWQTVARQITHEIKNSLTPISISLHQIRKQLNISASGKIDDNLNTIKEELAMLQKMATTFSDFARMPEPRFESLQLNSEIESACYLTQNTFPHIIFETSLNPAIPCLQADQDQIRRVLNNLLKNAAESIAGQGKVTVRTDYNADKRRVTLTIQDNGSGMSPNVLSQIFKPYFSRKKRGTGLGLAIVYKIVHSHHGNIEIESEPGSGTCVRIQFPVKTGMAQETDSMNNRPDG